MVEAEEEYVEQLEILISCFLRPFKMAASSKNPPCSHEVELQTKSIRRFEKISQSRRRHN